MNNDPRVAIVTGGYGAIGLAIARQLAAKQFEVVVAGRNEAHARQAVAEIKRTTGSDMVRYELVDLARQASIRSFAGRWQGPLHVLINNAGATPRRREETPEGIEVQFATNVLGYFWMVRAFSEALKQSAPARIVNVASYYAGDLDLDDLEFKRRPYRNGQAYRQSKQANRMLTVAQAERLKPFDITVNACHPGDVNSKLSNDLGFRGSTPPDQGARTPVWLATQPIGRQETGKYFAHMRQERDQFAQDKQAVERLYEICESY